MFTSSGTGMTCATMGLTLMRTACRLIRLKGVGALFGIPTGYIRPALAISRPPIFLRYRCYGPVMTCEAFYGERRVNDVFPERLILAHGWHPDCQWQVPSALSLK